MVNNMKTNKIHRFLHCHDICTNGYDWAENKGPFSQTVEQLHLCDFFPGETWKYVAVFIHTKCSNCSPENLYFISI